MVSQLRIGKKIVRILRGAWPGRQSGPLSPQPRIGLERRCGSCVRHSRHDYIYSHSRRPRLIDRPLRRYLNCSVSTQQVVTKPGYHYEKSLPFVLSNTAVPTPHSSIMKPSTVLLPLLASLSSAQLLSDLTAAAGGAVGAATSAVGAAGSAFTSSAGAAGASAVSSVGGLGSSFTSSAGAAGASFTSSAGAAGASLTSSAGAAGASLTSSAGGVGGLLTSATSAAGASQTTSSSTGAAPRETGAMVVAMGLVGLVGALV